MITPEVLVFAIQMIAVVTGSGAVAGPLVIGVLKAVDTTIERLR